jgi:hypothetical protein
MAQVFGLSGCGHGGMELPCPERGSLPHFGRQILEHRQSFEKLETEIHLKHSAAAGSS